MNLIPHSSPERKLKLCVMPICSGKRYDLVHKFPMDNERARTWLDIINVPELKNLTLEQIRKRHFICSKHFRKQDYKNCESRSLNKTANPQLLLGVDDIQQSELQLLIDANCANRIKTDKTNNTTTIHTSYTLTPIQRPAITPQIRKTVESQRPVKPTLYNNAQTLKSPAKILEPIPKVRRLQMQKPVNNDNHVLILNKPGIRLKQIPATKLMTAPKKSKIVLRKSNEPMMTPKQKEEIASAVNVNIERLSGDRFDDIDVAMEPQEISDPSIDISSECSSTVDLLSIEHKTLKQPLKVDSFWLRDHCRCSKCYGPTFQRSSNIMDIPFDVKPTEIKEESATHLNVKWSDGHESSYDVLELDKMLNYQLIPIEKQFWSQQDIKNGNYARVTLNDYLCNDVTAKNVVSSLVRFGFAFIDNVPANIQSTEIAIKRLFPIQRTVFGEMWSFSDTKVHNDTAYTTESLPPHNDNTYFNDAAGLQVFHCVNHQNGTGGDSIFVDGFHVAKSLQAKHPKAYEYLCKTSIPCEYIEDGYHFKHYAPVINADPITNDIVQMRFNMNDRAALNNIPQDKVHEFYKNFRLLGTEVLAMENQWHFKLNPGTVAIFDNWRLMHGRNAYTGKRQMVGCYVSRCEYLSVARKMDLII